MEQVAQVAQEWLTVGEVAQRFGLSRWTVRRLGLAGKLPAFRFGGDLRFRASDVAEFFERSKVGAAA